MFKLSCALCVEPEIRLQRYIEPDTFGDIHKRAARPYRTVQRSELVVCRRNQLHKVGLYHFGVAFIVHGTFKVGVDHARLCDLFSHIVVNQLAVILCTDTCERFSFRLRDAKVLKRLFYILGHIVPVGVHTAFLPDVCDYFVHIKLFYGRTPVDHIGLVVNIQRVQAQFTHPVGITLFLRDLVDYLRCKSAAQKAALVLFKPEIVA